MMPVTTDLLPEEIKGFYGVTEISTDDVLALHTLLKKETLWNLLQKKDKNLVKKTKRSEGKENSQQ